MDTHNNATAATRDILKEAKLASAAPAKQTAAAAILEQNPAFDMSKQHVATLADADDQTTRILQAVQRIQNVSPDASSVQELLDANFSSATQIAALKPVEFAGAVPNIPKDKALQIHSNATGVVHRNQMFLATVAPSMAAEATPVRLALANTKDEPGVVNLDTLFGESVTTKCDDCQSVLSPAAYLVDLLESLPDSVKAELLRRRPDIGDLELSCANTNTELPYIDLVNEVLESYIGAKKVEVFNNYDGDDSRQLIAEPRALDDAAVDAYDWLAKQATPIGTLPFDRYNVQSRNLLESLGTNRETILKTFGQGDETAKRALAAEVLELPETEYIALTGQTFTPDDTSGVKQPYELWGMGTQLEMLHDFTGLTAVKDQFLPRTGLTYDDLIDLLATNFIRGPIPEVLLEAPGKLEDLWAKVHWTQPDDTPEGTLARWGDLLDVLHVSKDVNSSEAAAVISAFPTLPNMATIVSTGRAFPADTRQWSIHGSIYFSEGPDPAESERLGTLGPNGMLTEDGTRRLIAYFDDHGGFSVFVGINGNPVKPHNAYMAHPFDQPGNEKKIFWLKTDSNEAPVAKIPRVQNPDGTVTNGQMVIVNRTGQILQSLGPGAGSEAAGWVLSPLPQDGEPDPENLSIRCLNGSPLSLGTWYRMNWFVRVMRRLGWTIGETDRVLSAFASDVGEPGLVERLALLKTVQRMASLTLDTALALFSDINMSLYNTLFLKQSVVRTDPDLGLSDAGFPKFQALASPKLMEHADGIGSALGISPGDIATIIFSIARPAETTLLSLKSLSLVYRHVLLCKAINQPFAQLSSLLSVFGKDYNPFSTPQTIITFIEFWNGVLAKYKITPAELDHLMTGNDVFGQLNPVPTQVLQVAMAIKTVESEPNAAQHAVQIYSAAFDKVPTDIVALLLNEAAFQPFHVEPTPHDFQGYFMPPATGSYTFSGVVSLKDTSVSNTGTPSQATVISDNLVGGQFYSIQGSNMTMSYKSSTTDVEDVPIPDTCLLALSNFQETQALMTLLSRYSILFSIAKVASTDVEHILNICRLPAPPSALSLGELQMLIAYDEVRSSFTNLNALAALLGKPPSTAEELVQDICSASGWETHLVAGLLAKQMPSSATPGAPSEPIELPKLKVDITILQNLGKQYALCKTLDVTDAATVFAWADPHAAPQKTADQVRALARSHVDESTWADTAASLFDKLRSASRDALIAGCLHLLRDTEQVYDSDGLFEYFLIDVNMGTCLKTSRIKQALSSIQLFVQRCLLGLELKKAKLSAASFSDAELVEWEWKKSIETWTANRKIFLYPENWLEPSLRDNKSEAFVAVEAALTEGKCSFNDLVSKYVAGMLDVADLEPLSMYEGPGNNDNHIFARTRTAPHQFFYRRYNKLTDLWTAWENVGIDIPTVQIVRTLQRPLQVVKFAPASGSNVIDYSISNLMNGRASDNDVSSVMRNYPNMPFSSGSYVCPLAPGSNNDNLIVFLPTLTERSYKLKDDTNNTRLMYYWEIGMSFSQRRDGKWTPRQLSAESLSTRAGSTGQFPWMVDRNKERRKWMGIGARDIDEHLMNQGSFFFFPHEGPDGTAAIGVYLASAISQTTIISNTSVSYLWLGEFALQNGHCYVRQSRTSEDPSTSDAKLDDFPNSREWLFQGRTELDAAKKFQMRTVMWTPFPQPYNAYITPKTVDLVPQDTSAPSQFAKRTMAFTTRRQDKSTNSSLYVPLSNSFAGELQGLISAGKVKDIFTYLNDDGASQTVWPMAVNPDTQNASTTSVLQQAFGLVDSSIQYFWYHEQRTPIAIDSWELCMHLPMLLADTYTTQQQYDAAIDTIKLVFDPTAADQPGTWRFLPFRELASKPQQTPGNMGDVAEWTAHPFSPFVVARGRHVAYMKWFVYKYIEVMVAKGDAYFRRFTLESINLAIQCYVEAAHVFGPPVQTIASVGKRTTQTYNAVRDAAKKAGVQGWDEDRLSNVLVNMETLFPFRNEAAHPAPFGAAVVNIFGSATGDYFCVPANPALTALRSLIDDRLYKIRHCQDIDGNVRQIALWEPPLDPGALVASIANGTPLGSVADLATGALPNFRFAHLIRQSLELCSEVKSLGITILSLRERKDTELLASLRLEQQTAIGQRLRDLRKMELEEANKVLEFHQGNRDAAVKRMEYLLDLLGEDRKLIPTEGGTFTELPYGLGKVNKDRGFPLSQYETREITMALQYNGYNLDASISDTVASFLGAIPTFTTEFAPLGVGGSVSFGGNEAAAEPRGVASILRMKADIARWTSENAARLAQWERQTNERRASANATGQEITGIDVQMDAQRVRIAQTELRVRLEEETLDQDAEMDNWLRSKYTSTELYTWALNGLQGVYYALYNLALDTAAQAERAFNFERGIPLADAKFITGGYWNSTRDGLYAGEQLGLALRRLQNEHINTQTHDFELSRSVSLRQVAPLALAKLRREGKTEFELPEALWDMDFPGHCNRRIRSVNVIMPCVVGAYTPVNATLALAGNSFRTLNGSPASVPSGSIPVSSAAISSAASDAGVFELSFYGERYMPFEGAGVVSKWDFTLNSRAPAFSYSTISDLVLQIRYTSNKGSTTLTEAAGKRVDSFLAAAADASSSFDDGLCLYADARAEFATAWAAFRATGKLRLQGLNQRLPFFARAGTVTPFRVKLAVELDAAGPAAGKTLLLTIGDGSTAKSLPFKLLVGEGKQSGKVAILVDPVVPEVVPASEAAEAGGSNSGLRLTIVKSDLDITWRVAGDADDWVFDFQEADASGKIAAAKGLVSLQVLVSYTLQLD